LHGSGGIARDGELGFHHEKIKALHDSGAATGAII